MTVARSKAPFMSRLTLLACTAGVGGGMAIAGGCGWTARDEFYRNRSLVLAPQAGDGSQITSTTTIPGAPLAGLPQMAEGDAQPSGRARH